MITVTLFGAAGRMGQASMEALQAEHDIEVIHAVDIEACAGKEVCGLKIEAEDEEQGFASDVWVDMSLAEPAYNHARRAAKQSTPILIGATGLSQQRVKEIEELDIPKIIAPNLSPGMNLVMKLAPQIRKTLKSGFDVGLIDTHHRHKLDSPSGTAKRLVEGLESEGEKVQVVSLRIGEVVGEHRIIFSSDGEEVELIHRARSRMAFASGIAPAVRFLAGQKPGNYSMADVLGL